MSASPEPQLDRLLPPPSAPLAIPADLGVGVSDSGEFLRAWLSVRRHWLKIALFTVMVVVLTAIYEIRQPKIYSAIAYIRVDTSLPSNIVSGRLGGGSQVPQNIVGLLATEAAELKNPAVVVPVILKLHLQHAANLGLARLPADAPSAGLVSQVALNAVTSSIRVVRPAGTYLLAVHFRSRSPRFSAHVANALAAELIHHEYVTRASALLASSRYMRDQESALRARMESSQVALNAFERSHDIVNPRDKFQLINQRLQAIATDLDVQRLRQRQLASELTLVRRGSLDALLVSGRGKALAGLLAARQAQQLKLAGIGARYGPKSFVYEQASRHFLRINAAVNREKAHIARQIRDQARAQAAMVALTQSAFQRQKAELNRLNARTVEYSILKHEADSRQLLYDNLLQRIQAADVSAGYHSDLLRIVGAANPDPIPVAPRVKLAILMAAFLALVFSVGTLLMIAHFDRTLNDPEVARASLGVPLLGSLPFVRSGRGLHSLLQSLLNEPVDPNRNEARQPDSPGMIPESEPSPAGDSSSGSAANSGLAAQSAFAEALLGLRTSLFLSSAKRLQSVAVTSAQPREGKSTISVNLAAACARQGMRTALLDVDLRRPEVHRVLGLSNRRGLSNVLLGDVTVNEALQRYAAPDAGRRGRADNISSPPFGEIPFEPRSSDLSLHPRLMVITAGPSVINPSELLAMRLGPVLEELKSRFDALILDCPPTLGFADTKIVGPLADAVMIVVRAGETPREFARGTVEQLRQVRAEIAGFVINGVDSRLSRHYYYYKSYYHRYYTRES